MSTGARELRRRIGYGATGQAPSVSRKEVVALLLLDDPALLALHGKLTNGAAGKTCADIAAALQGICGYAHVKAMARLLHLLTPQPRPGDHWQRQPRDGRGAFVAKVDLGDVPPDRQALIRRWIATGVAPDTAKRWAEEMGASEGLT